MNELTAYLGLGGNVGERVQTLRLALYELTVRPELTLTEVSSFYETAPWGKTDQADFLNAAVKIHWRGDLSELLQHCQAVEHKLGRVRRERWGPRTIDIDILHVVGCKLHTPELTLPHPHLTQRAFVLVPLREIAPDLIIDRQSVAEHEKFCPDTGAVVKTAGSPRDFALALIACVDSCGGLSRQNKLLFDLPTDMAFFRRQTEGQCVIMGANTLRSLPNGLPLNNRVNIVLSRRLNETPDLPVCRNLGELWKKLADMPSSMAKFVIGGATVYSLLLPYADQIYLTQVEADGAADLFFPPVPPEFVLSERHASFDPAAKLTVNFCRYVRSTSLGNISQ